MMDLTSTLSDFDGLETVKDQLGKTAYQCAVEENQEVFKIPKQENVFDIGRRMRIKFGRKDETDC